MSYSHKKEHCKFIKIFCTEVLRASATLNHLHALGMCDLKQVVSCNVCVEIVTNILLSCYK